MTDRFLIHDRVGLRGQPVPVDEGSFIDIPEEFYDDLVRMQEHASELDIARNELGRLMQIVHHLINVSNSADVNLANAKQGIINKMGLEDGNWAIDFDRKQIGRVVATHKQTPRVV